MNTQERQNLRNLLLSRDNSNQELALQLIKSMRMHNDFVVPLIILAIEKHFESVKFAVKKHHNVYEKILENCLFPSSIAALQNIYRTMVVPAWFCFINELNKEVQKNDFPLNPYWEELAKEVFWRTGEGGKECYNHQLLTLPTIIHLLLSKNTAELDLGGFLFKELPTE